MLNENKCQLTQLNEKDVLDNVMDQMKPLKDMLSGLINHKTIIVRATNSSLV